MNEQAERIEKFLDELERGLAAGEPVAAEFSPAERQALHLAGQLRQADFSAGSPLRLDLRLRLARQAAARLPEVRPPAVAAPLEPGAHPASPRRRVSLSARSLGWAGLAAVLVIVLGLAFHSLGPQPGQATPALTRTLFTSPTSPALVSTLAETLSPARTVTPAERVSLAGLPYRIRPVADPAGDGLSRPSPQTPSAVPLPVAR